MKIILAVSGGIDSMTLLHYVVQKSLGRGVAFDDGLDGCSLSDIIVAHFNHGTRPSANDDELFVKEQSEKYGVKFVSKKANLGENVAEAVARKARYAFLREVAASYGGGDDLVVIMTAHHLSDVIESIAINLIRGTGWRGLRPMHATLDDGIEIRRPLLYWEKKDILKYAATNGVIFRQDPTNTEPHYLRNRVREALSQLKAESYTRLAELWQRQGMLAKEIDELVAELSPKDGLYQRAWFSTMDNGVALEILRAGLLRVGVTATRPQILDFLEAIRTYAPEKEYNLPKGRLVKIHKTYFML